MCTTPDFAEQAVEHAALASETGFSCRTLLVELLHAGASLLVLTLAALLPLL
jgi:hypothetical protein